MGRLENFVSQQAADVVAVTYAFDPPDQPVQPMTVRFTGRRAGVTGRPKPGDEFVHDEIVADVLPGSGPVSVTAKIRADPGEWSVRARLVQPKAGRATRVSRQPSSDAYPAVWSWRRWRLERGPATTSVETCLAPLAPTPAVVLGSWLGLVVLGIVLALLTQRWVVAAADLRLEHVLTISLLIVLAGAVGAKVWYIVLQRQSRRRNGWAVQGLVTAIVVVAPLLLLLWDVPVGPYLDATAPAVMVGLGTGRLGCFFTGCCAGRPTASRWGIWSSNRRVGARRVPTQLMESVLAFGVAAATLVAVLSTGSQHGAYFIATIAAFTLIRQALLRLREEGRQSRSGTVFVAVGAGLALLAALVLAVTA